MRQSLDDGGRTGQHSLGNGTDKRDHLGDHGADALDHGGDAALDLLRRVVVPGNQVRETVHETDKAGEHIGGDPVFQPAEGIVEPAEAVLKSGAGGNGLVAHDHTVVLGFFFERGGVLGGHVEDRRHVRSRFTQKVSGGGGAFRTGTHLL